MIPAPPRKKYLLPHPAPKQKNAAPFIPARKVREFTIDMGQNNRRYGKVFFYIPEKGRGRKSRKIFEKGRYIFSAEEKE